MNSAIATRNGVLVVCVLTILTLVPRIGSATDLCADTLGLSYSIIPPIMIAPDYPTYTLQLKDEWETPISGARVTITFPSCFGGSLVPLHPPGAWANYPYVPGSSFTFVDSTDISGVANFNWSVIPGPDPSGGCLPVDMTGSNSACAESLDCRPATIAVLWNDGGTWRCGEVARNVVSPDIANGGRFCDESSWTVADTSEVGLADAVEFTPPLATATYDPCIDLNGDNRIDVVDAVKFTPYVANGVKSPWSPPMEPFYGDSLNLPFGVGDDESVIEHAIGLSLVEAAMDTAEARGYVRSPGGDRVACMARSDGLRVTMAYLTYDVPGLAIPDSTTATAILDVVTWAMGDSCLTSVNLQLVFADTRNPTSPTVLLAGDSTEVFAVLAVASNPSLVGLTSIGDLEITGDRNWKRLGKCMEWIADFAYAQYQGCIDLAYQEYEDEFVREHFIRVCVDNYWVNLAIGHRRCLMQYWGNGGPFYDLVN